MTCPNCNHATCQCWNGRSQPSPIPAHAPETLGYIAERTGIKADDLISAVRQMAARINALQTALGAMTEQRDLFRQAYYQSARNAILAED